MMAGQALNTQIHQVVFGDMIEITYSFPHDSGRRSQRIHSMRFDPAMVQPEVVELLDVLRDVVEQVETEHRLHGDE